MKKLKENLDKMGEISNILVNVLEDELDEAITIREEVFDLQSRLREARRSVQCGEALQ